MNNLTSFKELLLKKAIDSGSLQELIPLMKDEILADMIIESLEKMSEAMGRVATAGVTAFGQDLTSTDAAHLNDAVSHHVSHYKSALKNGNRELADKHLNQIIPLMHFIGQAKKHSNGNLDMKYTNLRPWEHNYTSTLTRQEARDRGLSVKPIKDGADPTEFHKETDGLNVRLSDVPRSKDNPFSIPDYRYLEMPPHSGHRLKDVGHINPNSGYPFEDIRVGTQANIKAGKGHIEIQDIPKQDAYVPHPYDEHPAFKLVHKKEKQRNLGGKEKDLTASIQEWKAKHEPTLEQRYSDKYDRNPENFHGEVKSPHFHEGLTLHPQTPWPNQVPNQVPNYSPDSKKGSGLSEEVKNRFAPKKAATPVIDMSALPEALRNRFGGKK
jgi:hypothetical protein